MEVINTTTGRIDAESLLSAISVNRKSSRFKFPFDSASDAERVLFSFYKQEVSKRGRDVEVNDDLRKHLGAMAEWLVNSEKAGILLCGSCGNGKTTLLEATCRMINSIYPLSSRVRYEDELFYNRNNHAGIRWETAVKMADMCKKEDDFRSFIQSEWLAIDDLGQEPAEVNDYGNVRYPMRDLLCYRYDRNMLTIVTSNLTPKDISERYGERIADRLREMMAIELFTGNTYRR